MKDGDKITCPKCKKQTEVVTMTDDTNEGALATMCCLHLLIKSKS